MLQRFTTGLAGVLLSLAIAQAQSLTITAGTLRVGQSVDIHYSNPAKANGVVTVLIDDGDYPQATVVEVTIHLDASGKGATTWTATGWSVAHFNVDGVKEQTRTIQ